MTASSYTIQIGLFLRAQPEDQLEFDLPCGKRLANSQSVTSHLMHISTVTRKRNSIDWQHVFGCDLQDVFEYSTAWQASPLRPSAEPEMMVKEFVLSVNTGSTQVG